MSLWMNLLEQEFYAVAGPMTDVSTIPAPVLDGVPCDPEALLKVVRNCVTSAGILEEGEGLTAPEGRDGEVGIRPAGAMVARLLELQPGRLIAPRVPQLRLLGNCRSFATFACALLRHVGIPSRVRAGFAGYFVPAVWADHWVVEYWDARWVRVDPELDDEWLREHGYEGTSEAATRELYRSGSEAWRAVGRGELDPGTCNMGGSNWGIGEVRGSVLLDLAALNKHEMLPWDEWGGMQASYRTETGAEYDELVERVSSIVIDRDHAAIRRLYDETEELRVPSELLRT